MSDHTFNETVESLFKGMDNFLDNKNLLLVRPFMSTIH